ncbi:post-transcriptional regulator [Planococcus sp. 11815]|uniref:post-transcriptional regulator n=1 Tax=Planococcus sp. 11815 TaxID=2939413 RepID=UPI003DA3A539
MMSYPEKYEQVLPALESKCSEFTYLQYETFTPEALWDYCLKKAWKKKKVEDMRLHEMVSDIMDLTASDFVAYHQVEGFKNANFFSEDSMEDLQQLLRPARQKPRGI